MNPAIRVQNLRKDFRKWVDRKDSFKKILVETVLGRLNLGKKDYFNVLHDVSFEIQPGEFVGIMGRNGAGKSTLLKLISGIYTPTSGTIEISSRISPLIELGAGFVGDLSGYENIFLNAAILGLGQKATLAALPDILEFSELGEKIDMPVKNYSSGMLVRLGFSIAAHIPSPIILIDEILAVGDVGFQEKCINKIKSLHQAGHTIILITHTPDSVLNMCKRCIVIDNQTKVFDGDVAQGVNIYLKSVQTHGI